MHAFKMLFEVNVALFVVSPVVQLTHGGLDLPQLLKYFLNS